MELAAAQEPRGRIVDTGLPQISRRDFGLIIGELGSIAAMVLGLTKILLEKVSRMFVDQETSEIRGPHREFSYESLVM